MFPPGGVSTVVCSTSILGRSDHEGLEKMGEYQMLFYDIFLFLFLFHPCSEYYNLLVIQDHIFGYKTQRFI